MSPDLIECPVCGKTKGRQHVQHCRSKRRRAVERAESRRIEAEWDQGLAAADARAGLDALMRTPPKPH